ncbi:hypothetical protein M758_5G081500 [Ceratodon purpureus]|nr:hypothetical protein M758_5G081500 [Ceratodon purpureus]
MERKVTDDASVREMLKSREGGAGRAIMGLEAQSKRADDGLVMDPAMWGTLPKELIRLVCAHLPLPELLTLRRSALEDDWDINLDDSGFRRLCGRIHVNLCAVMVPGTGSSNLVYDVGLHSSVVSTAWQKLKLGVGQSSNIMSSSDGGLVCFALPIRSPSHGDTLVIRVVNPLTEDCRELPEVHGMRPHHPTMMKLVVDRNTKCYQVILLARRLEFFGEVRAMVFDSGKQMWTNSKGCSGIFFGLEYSSFRGAWGERPWSFDCATGQLVYLHKFDGNPCAGKFSSNCAHVKDHLFVIEMGLEADEMSFGDGDDGFPTQFSVSEHKIQVQKVGLSCTKVTDHHFGEIDHPGMNLHPYEIATNSYLCQYLRLLACEGFLLALGKSKTEFAWLYDLSTGEGLDLLKHTDGHQIATRVMPRVMFCELQWDAVP